MGHVFRGQEEHRKEEPPDRANSVLLKGQAPTVTGSRLELSWSGYDCGVRSLALFQAETCHPHHRSKP